MGFIVIILLVYELLNIYYEYRLNSHIVKVAAIIDFIIGWYECLYRYYDTVFIIQSISWFSLITIYQLNYDGVFAFIVIKDW